MISSTGEWVENKVNQMHIMISWCPFRHAQRTEENVGSKNCDGTGWDGGETFYGTWTSKAHEYRKTKQAHNVNRGLKNKNGGFFYHFRLQRVVKICQSGLVDFQSPHYEQRTGSTL